MSADLSVFAEDIYGLSLEEIDQRTKYKIKTFDRDYILGKFSQFKRDFPAFCQNLDQIRMDNLLKALNRLDLICHIPIYIL